MLIYKYTDNRHNVRYYKKEYEFMETENLPADGYYDEGVTAPKEDFDLSFLDEDETEEKE